MIREVVHERGAVLVRRLRLEPGEATPWHRDPFPRVTVVLSGQVLEIEFRDGTRHRTAVAPGQVDWDEPTPAPHRGVNVGPLPYEEVTVFLLDQPGAVPQPPA